jgi:hypothetical protein
MLSRTNHRVYALYAVDSHLAGYRTSETFTNALSLQGAMQMKIFRLPIQTIETRGNEWLCQSLFRFLSNKQIIIHGNLLQRGGFANRFMPHPQSLLGKDPIEYKVCHLLTHSAAGNFCMAPWHLDWSLPKVVSLDKGIQIIRGNAIFEDDTRRFNKKPDVLNRQKNAQRDGSIFRFLRHFSLSRLLIRRVHAACLLLNSLNIGKNFSQNKDPKIIRNISLGVWTVCRGGTCFQKDG